MAHAMKDGKLVHVDTVANGKKCGCTCPCCGAPLSAKQGSKQRHHFAHLLAADCKHGYESALHVVIKEILSKAKYFKTHPVSILRNYTKSQISTTVDSVLYARTLYGQHTQDTANHTLVVLYIIFRLTRILKTEKTYIAFIKLKIAHKV